MVMVGVEVVMMDGLPIFDRLPSRLPIQDTSLRARGSTTNESS
jgi:hypothetical protein